MSKIGYFNNATDDTGKPRAATITVYNAGTAVLASIWSDAGGTIVKDNPFITDVLGRFFFFASPGFYDLEVSGTGIAIYKMEWVPILGVPPCPTQLKTWWHFEDFIQRNISGLVGGWGCATSGTGASATLTNGTSLRPGIMSLGTGTTNTGYAYIQTGGVTALIAFLFGGGVYTIEGDIYITTLSDGTETYALRFGFGDGLSGAPVDGAYFYYTDVGGGGATPNWHRNTVSNSVLTSTDTGVAAVAGVWTRLKIVVNADATSVEYFINGVSVGSNVTNIPSGAGRNTGAICTLIKSAGTTARIVNIDWAWLHIDLMASR